MRPPRPPSRALLAPLLAAVALAAPQARAAFPEDVTISQLDQYQGNSVADEDVQEAWRTIVRDLGTGLANKPQGGSTLGIDGFDLSLGSTFIFVDGNRYQGGPTAWERAREGNQPAGAVWVPELMVRKGLPLSLEAGAHVGWVGFTRQGAVGGYGRFAPLEGHPKLPEVAFQGGYTGYVGNDELELGVTDLSLSVGKTVAFAARQQARNGTIHPFAAVALNRIRATPLLSPERLGELGIGPLTADKKDTETFDPDMRQVLVNLGVRIVSGDVGFKVGAAVPLQAAPTLDASVGYVF